MKNFKLVAVKPPFLILYILFIFCLRHRSKTFYHTIRREYTKFSSLTQILYSLTIITQKDIRQSAVIIRIRKARIKLNSLVIIY